MVTHGPKFVVEERHCGGFVSMFHSYWPSPQSHESRFLDSLYSKVTVYVYSEFKKDLHKGKGSFELCRDFVENAATTT